MDRCARGSIRRMCTSRREAMQAGEMFYSMHHGGWVWPAENRAVPRLLRERHQYPATWLDCPFCGGALPDE